jgi:hypothetical protein
MAKKCFFSVAIFIIAALVLYASEPVVKQAYPSGTELEPAAYPSGTELYPAIYGTFAELYPKARYASIDFYNNSYTLTGITGNALLTPITYDMTVQLSSSGEINISYANIYQYDAKARRWSRSNAFGLYDYKKAVKNVTTKIQAIANDSAAFSRAEKAAMADISFVYAIMDNMTELAFKDFIANYAKGSIFVLEGPVSDVKEYGNDINGITYKDIVTMNKNLIEDDSLLSILTNKTIYCRVYTNRDDVIRLSKTSVTRISGVLVSASKSVGGSLILDLATGE